MFGPFFYCYNYVFVYRFLFCYFDCIFLCLKQKNSYDFELNFFVKQFNIYANVLFLKR